MTESEPFSIYLHIPFCVRKCPYCDFNSHVAPELSAIEGAYTDALRAELRFYALRSEWSGRSVKTLFFGGGTPSLFQVQSIEKILTDINTSFPIDRNAEITLECNPGTIQEELGLEKISDIRLAGINRISLGAQSFSPKKLQFLGRIHSAADTTRAVENIRHAGITNFNLDLMFGTREETLADWQNDIQTALRLKPKHMSCYGLTIEPGTEFFKQEKRGVHLTADEELQAEMYQLTQSQLEGAGFLQYEISNYALPGFECLHNLTYWRRLSYLGLGAGAHSLNTNDHNSRFGVRWSNECSPKLYIEKIRASGQATTSVEHITTEQLELEFFFLGLRLREGVRFSAYETLFGNTIKTRHDKTIQSLHEEDLIYYDDNSLRLTKKGFLFADTVLSAFSTPTTS